MSNPRATETILRQFADTGLIPTHEFIAMLGAGLIELGGNGQAGRLTDKGLAMLGIEVKKPVDFRSGQIREVAPEKLEQELTQKKEELTEQKTNVVTLNTTISELQNTVSTYQNKIQNLEMHATEQQKENAKLDHHRQILSEDITEKTNKTEQLKINFKSTKEKMTKEEKTVIKTMERDR